VNLKRVPEFFPQVVGITGASRAGKDSAAQAFIDLGYQRAGFADKLKDLAWELNPILRCSFTWTTIEGGGLNARQYPEPFGERLQTIVGANDVEHWERAKDLYPEVRAFLIDLGNSARAVLGADIWRDTLLRSAPWPLVVPDVRFLNEVSALRTAADRAVRGCLIVRVTRPGHEPSDFEREVREVDADIEVVNDGTLEDLHFQVQSKFLDWMATNPSERVRSAPAS